MNTASNLFKELTYDEITCIVHHNFESITDFEYKLLKGGLYNTTYMITDTLNNTKYVLRVGPTNEHLIMPFEYNMMNAEKYAYLLCKEYAIPVSNVVVCDITKKIIDREYMLVDYINSNAMSNLQLDDVTKAHLYEDVGRYLHNMHEIKSDKFGRLSRVLLGESFDSWGDYIINEMNQWACKADNYTSILMPTRELHLITDTIAKYKSVLDKIKKPYLVHTDIWEGNILVSKINGEYEVAAIIDADRSLFGDPEFDLASGWMINDNFIRGYGCPLDMSIEAILRRKIYKFCLECFDAYALTVEYNNLTDGNEKIRIIREYISELL